MAAISWAFGVSGDWNNALYWTGGVAPGAGDDVTIDATGIYTVTLSTADAAHSLLLNSAGATVALNNGGQLTLGTTLDVTAGTFQLSGGVINGGTLTATGGTFQFNYGTLNGVTFEGPLNIDSRYGIFIGPKGLVVEGADGGGGTINLASGPLWFQQSDVLDNAAINLSLNAGLLVGNRAKGADVLTLGANAVINQVGKSAFIGGYGFDYLDNTIVNKGTVNCAYAGGGFSIGYSMSEFINDGTIMIAGEGVSATPDTLVNNGGITLDGPNTFFTVNDYKKTIESFVDAGTILVENSAVLESYAQKFSNSGTLTVETNASVTLGGGIVNSGTITVETGGTLVLSGSIANSGVITATGASITLAGDSLGVNLHIDHSNVTLFGAFSSKDLDVLANHRDKIGIGFGTVSNGGSTLEVGAGTGLGTVTLFNDSQINGGTIADAGGGLAIEGVTLNGVVYEGDLDLSAASAGLGIGVNGIVLKGADGTGPGTMNVSGDNAVLDFKAVYNIFDDATINLSGNHVVFYVHQSGGSHGDLTLGPDLTLDVTGASSDFEGPGGGVSNKGVLEVTGAGAQLDIAVGFFSNTGVLRASGGGMLELGAGAQIGSTVSGGTYEVDAGSTISITNGPSITTDDATIILSGAGSTFLSHGALETTLATIASGGTLELLAGRDWSSTLAMTNAGILKLGGGTFASAGVASSGILTGFGAIATALTNTGVIEVDAAQTLSFVGGDLTNLTGTTLTAGVFSVGDGGVLQLANDTSIVTLDAVLVLNGSGSVQGYDTATASQVGLKSSLVTIGASGALELIGRDFRAVNAIANMGVLQLGGGTFSGGKLTDLAGSELAGFGTVGSVFFDNGAVTASGGALAFSGVGDVFKAALGGTEIDFTGGTDLLAAGSGLTAGAVALSGGAVVTLHAPLTFAGAFSESSATLTVAGKTLTFGGRASLGAGAVVNGKGKLVISGAATLVGSAGKGTGVVEVAVSDAGLIEAAAGTLDLSQALTGAGGMKIDAGATLQVDGAAAKTLTASFAGSGATLALGSASRFASVIAGFAKGEVIELIKTAATAATLESGDRLLITNAGQTVATLQLSGSYAGAVFSVKMDPAGDARITVTGAGGEAPPPGGGEPLPPPAPAPGLFNQHMAAWGAGPGLASIHLGVNAISRDCPLGLSQPAAV